MPFPGHRKRRDAYTTERPETILTLKRIDGLQLAREQCSAFKAFVLICISVIFANNVFLGFKVVLLEQRKAQKKNQFCALAFLCIISNIFYLKFVNYQFFVCFLKRKF